MINPMNKSRGAALLIVLWMLALISVLAVNIGVTARTESHLVRNQLEETQAKYIAQAGIYRAVALLLKPQESGLLIKDGAVLKTFALFGASIDVRIEDECGKIDLNTGWGGLLVGLLSVNGADKEAVPIRQAILDWRDPDNRRRPGGAETDDYTANGYTYGSRNGLFESVEEVQQVRGMTEGLYRKIAADLTVDCLNAGVDSLAASPKVLASIPNADPVIVKAYLAARKNAARPGSNAKLPEFPGGRRYVEISPSRSFRITSTVQNSTGASITWQAVIWLTEDREHPYRIRGWRQMHSAATE